MEFGYTATPWFRKTKNEIDVENLNNYYRIYFEALDKCVERGSLSHQKAKELKQKGTEEYRAMKVLIPLVNDLNFRFEDIISKGLENMFEKALR